MAQYSAVFTTYGTQLLAKAIANNKPLTVTHFAVGDGNGAAVTVSAHQERLVNEKHRAAVSAVSLDPRNNKQVIFELTIPENVGGFYIREMGVFDEQNKLVAYANCPESFKPTLASGSGKVQVMRMILLVASSNAVTLTVDDSVIFVTRGQLTPHTITATSANGFDQNGHSHAIDKASTTQAGIVQLTNDTGIDSDKLGLTARAGRKLAQLIATIQQALNNYIPLNKRSSAVNSTSNENVATSAAVKTAYDKGVEAKTAADNAQKTADAALPITNSNSKELTIGDSKFVFQTDGNLVVIRKSTNDVIYAANRWVSKLGDTLTGILRTVGIASKQFGFGDYSQQYTSGAPFMVEEAESDRKDTYFPLVKGRFRKAGKYGAAFSFGYTTKQGEGDGFGRGIIHLTEDNGSNRYWAFEHNGDFYSANDVKTASGKSLNTAVQIGDYRSQWQQNGWVKLPNGLIIQWGKTPVVHDERTSDIVFPIAFPNKVLSIQLTENQMRTVEAHATHLAALNITNTKFTFKINSTLPIDTSADWLAIGY